MSIVDKLKKGLNDPFLIKSFALTKIYGLFTRKNFSGALGNRSDSDNGLYLASIKKILSSQRSFNNFKNDPIYQRILEHTTKEMGQNYLDIINRQTPSLLDSKLDSILRNDEVGNAAKCNYEQIGSVSPSTLYYTKIGSDLETLFGGDIGKNIVEIGSGYGGQGLILDSIFHLDTITLFDLPLVNKLISKYLECFTLNSSYSVSTLNEATPQAYDLVISNYAFSELPKMIQIKYIEKVLSNSARGYLIMNSGIGDDYKQIGNKLTLSELERLLPKFEVMEENPLTAKNNYLIVWGHSASLK
ncbi:MAG: putative sugar O-methyltransferase [Gammaproteobacteria bacterium]